MNKKNKIIDLFKPPPGVPNVVDANFDADKYNRKHRRHGAFVIKNNTNGLYLNRSVKGSKIIFKDVDLERASLFKFEYIGEIMNQALVGMPNLDLAHEMCYKKKGKRVAV